MTGKELWEQYQHYTRDITEHGRKLGFGGVAICWVLKRDDYTFPAMIYAALLFFVAYFLSDILHSLSGALMLKYFTQHHEAKMWREKRTIDGEIHKPRWVDRPAFFFFISKCLLLIVAFAFLGLYLLKKFF
ncbi:MAG: hypothetical protein ACK45B_06500 [Limisphaerales bacterium]